MVIIIFVVLVFLTIIVSVDFACAVALVVNAWGIETPKALFTLIPLAIVHAESLAASILYYWLLVRTSGTVWAKLSAKTIQVDIKSLYCFWAKFVWYLVIFWALSGKRWTPSTNSSWIWIKNFVLRIESVPVLKHLHLWVFLVALFIGFLRLLIFLWFSISALIFNSIDKFIQTTWYGLNARFLIISF